MRANNNQIGMIFIVIGMLIYSFHDLAVKMIANETTIFQLFITRAFVGVMVTLTCLKCLNYKIGVIPVYPKLTLIRCVLMHFGFFIFFISLEKLSLSTVTALFFAAPFFITILSALVLSERIGLVRVLIIVLGFIGVFLIVKPFKESEFSFFMLAPLFTAFSYAVAMVISKYTKENENAFLQAFQQYSVSLLLSVITYIIILVFPLDFINTEEWRFISGSIKFEWSGSDADSGDTLTYDIYVDTSNPPTNRIKANHTSSSINHPINNAGTYYWKIITKDNSGSNSDSGVSKFKVAN